MNIAEPVATKISPMISILVSVLLMAAILAQPGFAATYYVDPGGDDMADGSEMTPWLTIQHALDTFACGDTVIVNDGTYAETLTVEVTGCGAANPIVLRAANKHLAIIDGGNTALNGIVRIFDDVHYFSLLNFDINNGQSGGVSIGDSVGPNDHITISGNWIHDIGNLCTDTSAGIVGIRSKLATTNLTINGNLFSDIGRFATGESGCTNGNNNWQNHDHHVYTFGTNITITNNVFETPDRGWGVQAPAGSNLWTIANNTFNGANPDREGSIAFDTYDGNATNISVIGNIFNNPTGSMMTVANASPLPCAAVSGLAFKNNLTTVAKGVTDEFGTAMGGSCPGDISADDNQTSVADLGLVDAGAGDFHLEETSPAVNAGLAGYVTTDYDGETRVGLPDIGAFEFLSGEEEAGTIGLTITISVTFQNLTITAKSPLPPVPMAVGECEDIVPAIWAAAGTDQPFEKTAAQTGRTSLGMGCEPWASGPLETR